jgi:hypothetical protein
MVGPMIGVDARPMQTTKIGAVDDQVVNAGGPHLTECHLLFAVHRHSPFVSTQGMIDVSALKFTETSIRWNRVIKRSKKFTSDRRLVRSCEVYIS